MNLVKSKDILEAYLLIFAFNGLIFFAETKIFHLLNVHQHSKLQSLTSVLFITSTSMSIIISCANYVSARQKRLTSRIEDNSSIENKFVKCRKQLLTISIEKYHSLYLSWGRGKSLYFVNFKKFPKLQKQSLFQL